MFALTDITIESYARQIADRQLPGQYATRSGEQIMSPQTRVRKMKPRGRRSGPSRSGDGIRQAYYDPAIRHARRVTQATRQDKQEGK